MAYTPPVRFSTPMMLVEPTYTKVNGVTVKEYPKTGTVIFVSFRTFGGTETTENGVVSVVNTATVETWYNPAIKSNCALRTESGALYEIMGDPEDIDCRHQYHKFKVQMVKGGA